MRIRLKFRLDDQVVYGCFSSVQRIGSTNSSAVLYTPQELTEEEKSQARENIGVQDPNLLVVAVDANNKASHTAAEIYAFVDNGGNAVVKYTTAIYNLVTVTESAAKFTNDISTGTVFYQKMITIDGGGTATIRTNTMNALKNPNAITFTGAVSATYDGSKAVSVEIPKGASDAENLAALIETDMLPAVHNADGKILTDENGKIILRY